MVEKKRNYKLSLDYFLFFIFVFSANLSIDYAYLGGGKKIIVIFICRDQTRHAFEFELLQVCIVCIPSTIKIRCFP